MGKLNGFKEYDRVECKNRSVEERINDYKEIAIKNETDALMQQGARCMDCGTPFCTWGCSIGNLIPDFNDLIYKGEWKKAFEMLKLTNPFPEFTGRICPALCEGSCTLGVNRKPVTIKEIELQIIEKAFELGLVKSNPPRVRTGKKIAVIGSGPSGLSAAYELNSVGHSVVVFERDDEIGGLLRYGIPDFKLDKSVIDRRIAVMKEDGISFAANINVGEDYEVDKLMQNFDAILLCTGSTVPRNLQVQGRDLTGVHFAMDYLSSSNKYVAGKINKPKIDAKDKVVLVIGGGDTGSDCVGTARRQGAKEVYQYEIMSKPPVERDESMPWPLYPKTLKTSTSHEEGCIRDWDVETLAFEGAKNKLSKIKACKVNWENNDGRITPVRLEGSEFELEVDLVFIAMGFLHTQKEGLLNKLGIECDSRGNINSDNKYRTNISKIFAAGDSRTGQSLVVNAINDGIKAAKIIDNYLMGETSL